MDNLTNWETEYSRSERDIYHFVGHHLHYGWYPVVELDGEQRELLEGLRNSKSNLLLTAPETTLKWPLAAYLLDSLIWRSKRIAIVASTQREANRRYQGLLYPLDHLPQEFNIYPDLRTTQELRLPNGGHVKTFTLETKKDIQGFNPNILLLEDSQVFECEALVKPANCIKIQRVPPVQPWH